MGLLTINDHSRYKLNDLRSFKKSLIFCGNVIDDRGERLLKELSIEISNRLVPILFDADTYSLSIDGVMHASRRANVVLTKFFEENDGLNYVIDSTTLGFVELLYLLRWFKDNHSGTVEIIYAEPERYKSRINYISDFGKHEFDLSSHSGGFKGVMGFTRMFSSDKKSCLVAVLGFERARLGQLLELDEGAYIGDIIPVFGTPGFKVGWDKHSFFQSVDTLKDKALPPHFVSAFSPIDVLDRLEYIKRSSQDDLMLAPFGPKPLSLGIAVFLVNNIGDIALKYDHPKKKEGRSVGLGSIHRYLVMSDA